MYIYIERLNMHSVIRTLSFMRARDASQRHVQTQKLMLEECNLIAVAAHIITNILLRSS